MVKFYEETDLKPKRDNSNLFSTSSLLSPNKEIQIQEYNNKDGQYIGNVQHQQEIGSIKSLSYSTEDYLILKVVHIPGRINVTTDRLSQLEMSRDYQLKEEIFQRIQRMWRCYPKVDLFASKRNRLTRTYASVILRGDPDNVGNVLRMNWKNVKGPVLLHPPIPLLLKVSKKFKEKGKIAILIAPAWKGQVWLHGNTKTMSHPYFLLLQEMFYYRGITLIDAYLNRTA
jgi:hypothetical protein